MRLFFVVVVVSPFWICFFSFIAHTLVCRPKYDSQNIAQMRLHYKLHTAVNTQFAHRHGIENRYEFARCTQLAHIYQVQNYYAIHGLYLLFFLFFFCFLWPTQTDAFSVHTPSWADSTTVQTLTHNCISPSLSSGLFLCLALNLHSKL